MSPMNTLYLSQNWTGTSCISWIQLNYNIHEEHVFMKDTCTPPSPPFRSPCSAWKDTTESREAEPQARGGVPGAVCWCGGVQVAISGLHPLPDQHWDRGGEEKGGGALPARLCPPDAEAVGFKGRCHVWSAVSETQNHLTVPVWKLMNSTICTYFFHCVTSYHFFPCLIVTILTLYSPHPMALSLLCSIILHLP